MRHFLVITLALLWACHYDAARVSHPQDVRPDIRERSDDTSQCGAMCTHLQALKCAEGNSIYNSDLPGPSGVPNQSCSEFCVELQTKGVRLAPSCVVKVPSCIQIETYRAACL